MSSISKPLRIFDFDDEQRDKLLRIVFEKMNEHKKPVSWRHTSTLKKL